MLSTTTFTTINKASRDIINNCKKLYPNTLNIIDYSLKECDDIAQLIKDGFKFSFTFDDEIELNQEVIDAKSNNVNVVNGQPYAYDFLFFFSENDILYNYLGTGRENYMQIMYTSTKLDNLNIIDNKLIINFNKISMVNGYVRTGFQNGEKGVFIPVRLTPMTPLIKLPLMPFKAKDPKKCIDPLIFKNCPITYVSGAAYDYSAI